MLEYAKNPEIFKIKFHLLNLIILKLISVLASNVYDLARLICKC